MVSLFRTLLTAVALMAGTSALAQGKQEPAPATGPADVKCTDPLPDCTKQRIAALRRLARGFGNALAAKPAEKLEPEQKEQVDGFDRWLRTMRADALRLATTGERVKGEGTMRAFNLQFLQFQETVQKESRRYATISTIMRNKHDAAMNAVRNIK
jgi:hypothetical protein